MNTLIILGIFSSIKSLGFWGYIASFGLGLGFAKKIGKFINLLAKWVVSFADKIIHLFTHIKETGLDIDNSIDDTTGKISLDKKDEIIEDVKDVIESSKEVADTIMEVTDTIKSIKK